MKKRDGFTLVEIMIVVAIIALLAAISIPGLIRAKITAGDASARSALKSIASAMETFYASNGSYPNDVTLLMGDDPPYLSKDYFSGTVGGFTYGVDTLTSSSYDITAYPLGPNYGTQSVTISTGANFN